MPVRTQTLLLSLLAMLAIAPLGCLKLGNWTKRRADKQTYPIVAQKQAQVLGTAEEFTIEPTTSTLTRQVLAEAGMWTPAAGVEQSTTSGLVISLADALALAVDNSREWQSRKEDLYLAALELTGARHDFSPIFSGTISAQATRQPSGLTGVERFGEITTDWAVTKLFATGARVSVGLSTEFFRRFTALGLDPPGFEQQTGALSATIVQPLLRGAGPLVVTENLTQAERDVIYEVRDFARFRKDFIINTINSYYRLLQSRDEIQNELSAYERLILSRERAEFMQQAERIAAFEVDQARQDEISARNRWIVARANYINDLNQFKVDLGLPTELDIQPDPAELQALSSAGLVAVGYDVGNAEREAIAARLDYRTTLDRIGDTERRLLIAENSLLPDLNVRGNLSMIDDGENHPLDMNWNTRRYSGGADLGLPFDRFDERNNYRRALIVLERTRRDAHELRNVIVAEVRRAYQDIEEARQTYEIQLISLALAEKRVDNVQMLMDAGREGITIRDQLEAQADLRDAQNEVTRALVDYTIARLNFYNAIEALEIDERGMWHENATSRL